MSASWLMFWRFMAGGFYTGPAGRLNGYKPFRGRRKLRSRHKVQPPSRGLRKSVPWVRQPESLTSLFTRR